jgi:hypothetical protein
MRHADGQTPPHHYTSIFCTSWELLINISANLWTLKMWLSTLLNESSNFGFSRKQNHPAFVLKAAIREICPRNTQKSGSTSKNLVRWCMVCEIRYFTSSLPYLFFCPRCTIRQIGYDFYGSELSEFLRTQVASCSCLSTLAFHDSATTVNITGTNLPILTELVRISLHSSHPCVSVFIKPPVSNSTSISVLQACEMCVWSLIFMWVQISENLCTSSENRNYQNGGWDTCVGAGGTWWIIVILRFQFVQW